MLRKPQLENGVLLAGSHLLIAKTLQPKILQKIHQDHMEIEKCKLRAKYAECTGEAYTKTLSRRFQNVKYSKNIKVHHQNKT